MTIAAGFVCSDGLIFASDTLYSAAQNTYGRKFWKCMRGETVVVFGGSGLSGSLKRTRAAIEHDVTMGMDLYQIVTVVEKALAYVEQKVQPAEHERTYALVGIRINGKCWLYHNDGGRSVLDVVDTNSHCVGAGHSLGLYFARSLFTTNMPLRWGRVVAAHLIKNVKKYESGYCGGDTHLLELPAVGQPRLIGDQDEIQGLEQHLAEVEEAMRIVLPEDGVSDQTLNERLMRLTGVIKNLQRAHYIHIPAAHVPLSGGTVMSVVGWNALHLTEAGKLTPTGSESQAPKGPPDPSDPKDEK